MARSLLSSGHVSLPEAAPCTAHRQKPYPAYPFRGRRRRSLPGPTRPPATIILRRWSTAIRQSTTVTIARRRNPPRNAAPTMHRQPRPVDRVTARPLTRRQGPTRTIATPPPNNVPMPMRMPTLTRALTPMQPSAPQRNPAPPKQTMRKQPQSRLPRMVLRPIPKPARRPQRPRFNRPKQS